MALNSPPPVSSDTELSSWLNRLWLYLVNLPINDNLTTVPTTSTSTGTPGQMAFDDDFFYVCTATDTWKRTPFQFRWDNWWIW